MSRTLLHLSIVLVVAASACAPTVSRYHRAKARMIAGKSHEVRTRSDAELEGAENAVGQMENLIRSMTRTVELAEEHAGQAGERAERMPTGKGNYSRSKTRGKRT